MSTETIDLTDDKQCTGPCGQVKPLTEFSRDSSKPDGRERKCKECRRTYRTSPEGRKLKAAACKRYRDAHPGKAREKSAAYYAEHREEQKEAARERYWQDPEKERARFRARHAAARARYEESRTPEAVQRRSALVVTRAVWQATLERYGKIARGEL